MSLPDHRLWSSDQLFSFDISQAHNPALEVTEGRAALDRVLLNGFGFANR